MAKQNEETIYQKRTSQGYWVSMYFFKIPFDYWDETDTHHFINAIAVAMRVGVSKNHNLRWFDYDSKFQGLHTTGNGNLENLKVALELLQKYERKHPNTTIVIQGEDDRRYNAYRWLKRYGYVEYEIGETREKSLVKLRGGK